MAADRRTPARGLRSAHGLIAVAALGLHGVTGCALFKPPPLPEGAPLAISILDRDGRVLIIREPNYTIAAPGAAVEIGDRVATLTEASVTLRYTALDAAGAETGLSCEIELAPNSELLVRGRDDCREPLISELNPDHD